MLVGKFSNDRRPQKKSAVVKTRGSVDESRNDGVSRNENISMSETTIGKKGDLKPIRPGYSKSGVKSVGGYEEGEVRRKA